MATTFITPCEIKDLRKRLRCTQDEFAVLLGVTSISIYRYELQNGVISSRPIGEAERRLLQLKSLMSTPKKEKEMLLLKQKGGIAGVIMLLTLGICTFGFEGRSAVTLGSILSTPLAGFLGIKPLKELLKD